MINQTPGLELGNAVATCTTVVTIVMFVGSCTPGDDAQRAGDHDASRVSTERTPSSGASGGAKAPLRAARAFDGPGDWGAIALIRALGDSLFVYDLFGSPAVTVLDRASGGVIGAFGRKGAGPGEFRDVGDIFGDLQAPGSFWVLDRTARRLSQYGSEAGGLRLLRTVPLEIRGFPRSVRVQDAGLVIAGVFEDGSPVLATDGTGRRIRARYGEYPARDPRDSSRTDLMVNSPLVSHHPDGTRMVLAYRHFNLLQFYDFKHDSVTSVAGPDPFEPVSEDLLAINPGTFAYALVRSTARYVYAVFCGCTNADRSRPLRMQVFSWGGELLGVWPIDHRSWQWVFEVAPDDRFMYTMTDDPYPQVLETALPPELWATGER